MVHLFTELRVKASEPLCGSSTTIF